MANNAKLRADAERFAFAAAISFPDLVEESGLRAAMFSNELLAQAFAALPKCGIRTPEEKHSIVEVATVAGVSTEALRPLLQAQVYTADQARSVWAKLRDLAKVDSVNAAVRAAMSEPLDEKNAAGMLIARLEAALRLHSEADDSGDTEPLLDVTTAYVRERSSELELGRRRGVTTGLEILDQWAGGLNAGELTTIVAAGGVGKSTIAMDISRRVARNGTTVLYWSAEMTARQLGQREVHAALARPISDPTVTGVDLAVGLERLENERHGDRIRFAFGSRPTVARLLAAARGVQNRHGLGLLVLDHLGCFDTERPRASEQEQVAFAVSACKDLAKLLDVPFLLITHFNRAGLIRGSERVRDTSDNVLELKRDPDDANALAEARLIKARQTGETHKAMRLSYSLQWQTYLESYETTPTPSVPPGGSCNPPPRRGGSGGSGGSAASEVPPWS